jgi:hypothetical protein
MSWYHRLQDLGYPFGTFPLSKGLWQSAGETSGKVATSAGYRKGVLCLGASDWQGFVSLCARFVVVKSAMAACPIQVVC